MMMGSFMPLGSQGTSVGDIRLHDKIGQMLLAGFRGFEIHENDVISSDLRERNLGGVILFDQEMADTTLSRRNIQSPEQVRLLVQSLHAHAKTPLWVAIDQEGGRVNRLKPIYGFPETMSHEELGRINDPSKTFEHARMIAGTLKSLGINVNLAPVVDLDANPNNPIIKGKKRSFSSDPEIVAQHAMAFARAHLEAGVLPCAKHFPGHGSAQGDTHCGLVDVTEHWSERELIPFQRLIQSGCCPLVMSAHVFNRNLDPERPATLSKSVLTGLLRKRLGFDGVILTDDMEMKAITSQFGLEKAVQYAIEAGADMLCFGNNLSFDAHVVEKATGIIYRLVDSGVLSESRINESFNRIQRLKGL